MEKKIMTADEFNQAKQLIKDTLSKRDGIGTGRQAEDKVYGSLAGSASTVASAPVAASNQPITAEQGQKTVGELYNTIKDDVSGFTSYPKQYEPIPAAFNLSHIQKVCKVLNDEKALSNGASSKAYITDKGTLTPETSSCKAACSGLCVGSCISFCNGCSGCTASCGTGCAGGLMKTVGS